MGNSPSAVPYASWSSACADLYTSRNLTEGLVDQYGNPTTVFDNNTTWGITVQACVQRCGRNIMYQAFSFRTFSTSATNWLLPWLALAAQLPYEASGTGSNIMSGLLAIGSPALITYSLTLTILNQSWIRRRFVRLEKDIQVVSHQPSNIGERISAAGLLLRDAQQAPMRVSQKDGWLSSLIVLRENQKFWRAVKKDLENTRRGFTASLFAQIFMAAIAFLFTIINAFNDVGHAEVALQMASGTVWIWMIPVILGWVIVGTQSRSGAIHDAIHENDRETSRASTDGARAGGSSQASITDSAAVAAATDAATTTTDSAAADNATDAAASQPADTGAPATNGTGGRRLVEGEKYRDDTQQGITIQLRMSDRRIKIPPLMSDPRITIQPGMSDRHDADAEVSLWLGCSVPGDEEEEGPIYNYSRIFTWFQCAIYLEKGFSGMLENLRDRNRVKHPTADSNGYTSAQVADYCGLPLTTTIKIYTPWSEVYFKVWHHILLAALIAIFVQWGTTGSAILISYLTPTKGLGCRSASYVLYGSLATLVWILLTCSSFLSHACMLRHQADKSKHNWILCALAVCTRYTGKILAALNAGWLVVVNLLEYIGTFEGCWCDADVLGLGNGGWVAIFPAASSRIVANATGYWAGGVAFSLLVCVASMGFFWLANRSRA